MILLLIRVACACKVPIKRRLTQPRVPTPPPPPFVRGGVHTQEELQCAKTGCFDSRLSQIILKEMFGQMTSRILWAAPSDLTKGRHSKDNVRDLLVLSGIDRSLWASSTETPYEADMA